MSGDLLDLLWQWLNGESVYFDGAIRRYPDGREFFADKINVIREQYHLQELLKGLELIKKEDMDEEPGRPQAPS